MSLNSIADARNAIGRLQVCFTAELISETFLRDPKLTYAVEVENASFTWDGPPSDEGKEGQGKKKNRRSSKQASVSASNEVKEVMFKLRNIDLKIPRGQLVAIVGAVGSGKTSVLQGLIGDMRKAEGSVRFGGSVAYCSQSAWIQVGYLSPCGEAQRAELVYRMQQSAIISVLVGPSRPNAIGRLFMTPAWSLTLTFSLTGT
jgi:ABC-type bacteriocin/lantibiotic exporter with double-glycine peptidase domain